MQVHTTGSRFPHCGIAFLAHVFTMRLWPVLSHYNFTFIEMIHARTQTMNFFLRCIAHQAEKGPFSIVLSLDARVSTGEMGPFVACDAN